MVNIGYAKAFNCAHEFLVSEGMGDDFSFTCLRPWGLLVQLT